MNDTNFPFVCTVNSSLEVFTLGLLTLYLHSDLLRQIHSAGSNHPGQTELLPLYVPRSKQEGDWKCIPSWHTHTTSIHGWTYSSKNLHYHSTMASPPSPLWLKVHQGEWHIWTEWILPAAGLKQSATHPMPDSPVTALWGPWTREILCSSVLLHLCSCLPLWPCALPAYGDRQAFDSSHGGPGSILAGQAVTWDSSPPTVSLNSFLDVLTSFLPHNLHWQVNLLFGSFMILKRKFFVECL